MNIEEAIYAYLSVHPDVMELASTRGYPMTIPQTSETPCYAYQVISQTEIMDHDGLAKLFTARLQFTCQAASYKESKQLARSIGKVLRGRKGLMGDLWIESGEILNEFDGYGVVGNVYTTRLDVGIMYRVFGNVPGSIVADVVYDWYVDSVNGSDSYDGKTSARPFKTIAKVMTVLGGSQTVGLARGSTWREQLTVAFNNVTVTTYGSGAAPILRCDEIALTAAWSNTSGHVYQFTPTVDDATGYVAFQAIWENDVRLPLVANVVACEAAPGSYYVANHATTTPTIYVHATGSGNPATNGKVYEYACRNFGFLSKDYTGISVTGIDCRRNLSESGSIRVGRSTTLVNCYAREGNKHNLYYEDGCTLNGVQALDAYYAGASLSLFVYNENTPIGLGLTHINCIANADTDGSALVAGTAGFYGHRNVSGSFGAVTFTGCQALQCAEGFSGYDFTSTTWNNCIGVNCYKIFSPTNAVTYNFINCTQTVVDGNTFAVIYMQGADDGATINIDDCVWNFADFAGGGSIIYSQTKDFTVNLNDNIFTIGGDWRGIIYATDGAAVTLYARNNNYQRTGAITVVPYHMADATSTINSDYNNFGHADMNFNIKGTGYASVALYKAGTGQDAHSTVG